jgi:hypothetical protein
MRPYAAAASKGCLIRIARSRRASLRLVLIIDVSELLAVVVAHPSASVRNVIV